MKSQQGPTTLCKPGTHNQIIFKDKEEKSPDF